MKVSSWNIRGCNDPLKLQEIKDFLWVFHITFVYASNDARERDGLWSHLINLKPLVNKWLILGDFNVIRDISEKIGGTLPDLADIMDFNSCLYQCEVEDLTSSGCDFSWNNKQLPESRVWTKLDRAMANVQWLTHFPATSAHFLEPGVSDHSPVVVTIFEDPCRKSRFSFLNCWLDHSDYDNIVHEAWNVPVYGSSTYKLFAKLKNVRKSLRLLHKEHFTSISIKVQGLKQDLKDCQLAMQADNFSPELISKEKELLSLYCKFKHIEKTIVQQQAKVQNLIHDDCSSKFFYAKIQERKHQQIIGQIKDRHGADRIGLDSVADGFVDYYKSLLGASSPVSPLDNGFVQLCPTVSSEAADALILPITKEEIKAALFTIGSDKSPGPDGFSSAFFKHSWSLIGESYCKAVLSFFSTGRMSKQANSTLIALIPKKKVSSTVMDFRPISCCTTFYKTISKIISTRLSTVLPHLIGPEQAAFVKGRSIHENIMLSQSLVKGYGRKYLTPRCLIKVDIRKAFDSLQWSFIENMLLALKFPPQFISWIMGCLTSSWFSLKLNGSVHGFFQGKSGVRQGDPLSPYIFLSGLQANVDKTEIYFGGVSPSIKSQILITSGFSEGSFPFRYLGLPLNTARTTVDMYGILVNKIQASIQHWSSKLLSYAGRLQLLNSVVFGIENFWCASVLLPKSVLKTINKLCKNFFWNIKATDKKMIVKSWSSICAPTNEGGFGVKELLSWNKALISKWLWLLDQTPQGLWSIWHSEYHLSHCSIWDVAVQDRYSESFRSIISVKNDLLTVTGSPVAARALLHSWCSGGKFQVAAAYNWFRPCHPTISWSKGLFHKVVVPRHNIITSLACQQKLATVDKLILRGFITPNRCVLCKQDSETHDHLFFACPFSQQLWHELMVWARVPNRSTDYHTELNWEVDIGLVDGLGCSLRPADLLLYSWDRGRDVCVDLTGSSPLSQTGLSDFVPGRVVADAA
ncbi:uncharacterized protein LOC141595191 [Silene latifolia]|uniref:uncharacterized protein LOC141595191 n=1 Tax=Silene latifolia TaxID=37657 RepID=UPI003D779050